MQSILSSYFSYENSAFGQIIYPEDIEFVLRSTPGIVTARVTELYLSGGSAGTRTHLIGGAGEIFIFTLDKTASTNYRNESQLFTKAGTVVTTPTFNSDTLAYDMTTVASSSKTLVFTHSTNASLVVTKVNGGVSSTVSATSSTTTNGITTSTYTFDVGTSAVTVKVSSRGGLSTTTYSFT
jgi:hypothetical protein